MDKRFFVLMFIALAALSVPSMAVVTFNSSIPTQDTYTTYPSNDSALCGTFGDPTISHGNETSVILGCQGNFPSSWHGLYQFNLSTALSKIVTFANFSVYRVNAVQCPNYVITLQASTNTSWNQNDVVQSLSQNGEVVAPFTTGNAAGFWGKTVTLSNPTAMNALYNSASGDMAAFETVFSSGSCNTGAGTKAFFSSLEGDALSIQPTWNFTLADYQTFEGVQTFNLLNRQVWVDFESGAASTSTFPQADFVYNIDTNTLTPLVPASAVLSEQDRNNNLASLNCFGNANYSTAPITSINVPTGNYWSICFNLTSQHAGRNFRGAIKVINNTANTFDFFLAQYSPSYAVFSTPTTNPVVPEGSRDITISWTSTQPLTTGLRYTYTLNNVTSAVATLSNPTLSTSHSVTINTSFSFGNAFYSYSLFGLSADSTEFDSLTSYNFTAIPFQEAIPDINEGITIIVTNEANIPQRAMVSIDGLPPIATAQILTNTSAYGFVQAISFFGFENGQHNITISADQKATKNIVINVLSQPFFLTVKLIPSYACIALTSAFTNTSCIINMQNIVQNNVFPSLNITGYYCQFDPSGCGLFDANGTCVQNPLGAWNGFGCVDGFFPAGFPVNATVPIGQTENQSPVSSVSNPVASAFGISSESAMAGISTLIIAILAFAAGIYIRNGVVLTVGILMLVFSFTFFGFIPLWLLLILVVLTVFLIARFVRQTMTPQ